MIARCSTIIRCGIVCLKRWVYKKKKRMEKYRRNNNIRCLPWMNLHMHLEFRIIIPFLDSEDLEEEHKAGQKLRTSVRNWSIKIFPQFQIRVCCCFISYVRNVIMSFVSVPYSRCVLPSLERCTVLRLLLTGFCQVTIDRQALYFIQGLSPDRSSRVCTLKW